MMRSRWFGLAVAAVAAAVSLWAYPRLPDTVATHWNLRGEPDGYSSRFMAVTLMPLAILGMTALFNLLPRLDPRRDNYEKFRDSYRLLTNGILVFTLAGHGVMLASGMGYAVQVDRLLPLGIGLLLVFLGNYLTRVEPNWFIGIRTPWTLSSNAVWRKTHRTGGWLFVIGGLVIAAAGFAPRGVFFPVMTATIVVIAAIPVVQSFVLWKRESNERP